jgi:hypothetical protein
MQPQEFRKLDIDLPRQPIIQQRPWWIAGWLLVFVILLQITYTYFGHRKQSTAPAQQKENNHVNIKTVGK